MIVHDPGTVTNPQGVTDDLPQFTTQDEGTIVRYAIAV